MKNSNLFVTLSLAVLAAIAAAPLRAQTSTAASTDAAIAHDAPTGTTGITPRKQSRPAGSVWIKGQVIHVDNVEIIFSEVGSQRMVHTFTYTENLKPTMQQIVNTTTYKYGDQVRILYKPETSVALKIHLKHAKTTS